MREESNSPSGGASAGSTASGRAVVLAIDLTPASAQAAEWVLCEFYRPGDTLHLVHVARIMSPNYTIQHGYQASYVIPDVGPPVDERQHLEWLKGQIKLRFTDAFDERGVPHSLHLFVDSKDAPAEDVCATLWRVCDEVNACVLALACHNKADQSGWDAFILGSVADYATRHSAKYPVVVVRSYGQQQQRVEA